MHYKESKVIILTQLYKDVVKETLIQIMSDH